MNLLDVTHLCKDFGGLRAVDDVTFHLAEGEILSIIGPNGAGKTTIFNVMTGIYPATRGEIRFRDELIVAASRNGMEHLLRSSMTVLARWVPALPILLLRSMGLIPFYRPHEIARRGIARTFQTIRLFPHLTALENVMAGQDHLARSGVAATLFRLPAERAEEQHIVQRAEHYLQLMGLAQHRDELARNLAYGDQRRLEIARALATEPKLLVLDEPAAGLNEAEALELMTTIRQIRDSGITILLIEHDMKVVMGISDRVVVLDNGRCIATGAPAEIQHNPDVITAYLGEEAVEELLQP